MLRLFYRAKFARTTQETPATTEMTAITITPNTTITINPETLVTTSTASAAITITPATTAISATTTTSTAAVAVPSVYVTQKAQEGAEDIVVFTDEGNFPKIAMTVLEAKRNFKLMQLLLEEEVADKTIKEQVEHIIHERYLKLTKKEFLLEKKGFVVPLKGVNALDLNFILFFLPEIWKFIDINGWIEQETKKYPLFMPENNIVQNRMTELCNTGKVGGRFSYDEQIKISNFLNFLGYQYVPSPFLKANGIVPVEAREALKSLRTFYFNKDNFLEFSSLMPKVHSDMIELIFDDEKTVCVLERLLEDLDSKKDLTIQIQAPISKKLPVRILGNISLVSINTKKYLPDSLISKHISKLLGNRCTTFSILLIFSFIIDASVKTIFSIIFSERKVFHGKLNSYDFIFLSIMLCVNIFWFIMCCRIYSNASIMNYKSVANALCKMKKLTSVSIETDNRFYTNCRVSRGILIPYDLGVILIADVLVKMPVLTSVSMGTFYNLDVATVFFKKLVQKQNISSLSIEVHFFAYSKKATIDFADVLVKMENLTSLSLKGYYLFWNCNVELVAKILAKILAKMQKLRSLSVNGDFEAYGAHAIAKVLRGMPNLTSLSIIGSFGFDGAQAIARELADNEKLTSVLISGNKKGSNIGDADATAVAGILFRGASNIESVRIDDKEYNRYSRKVCFSESRNCSCFSESRNANTATTTTTHKLRTG